MNIELQQIIIEDKPLLNQLLTDYQKEILKKDIVDEYKHTNSYWEKPGRYPYFVLINNYNILETKAKSISEFYIKKEFRKQDIGKTAAIKAFKLFPGKWEVGELRENVPAHSFWRKVIEEYTGNKFEEIDLSNEKWDGFVQTFDNQK